MTHQSSTNRSAPMSKCIENCTGCHAICLETINYCLDKGGAHASAEHIALLASCAEICSTCASAMLLGSPASSVICGSCAEVCRLCAESCERFTDDEQMKRCADSCRRCVESCTSMAGMGGMAGMNMKM